MHNAAHLMNHGLYADAVKEFDHNSILFVYTPSSSTAGPASYAYAVQIRLKYKIYPAVCLPASVIGRLQGKRW